MTNETIETQDDLIIHDSLASAIEQDVHWLSLKARDFPIHTSASFKPCTFVSVHFRKPPVLGMSSQAKLPPGK